MFLKLGSEGVNRHLGDIWILRDFSIACYFDILVMLMQNRIPFLKWINWFSSQGTLK